MALIIYHILRIHTPILLFRSEILLKKFQIINNCNFIKYFFRNKGPDYHFRIDDQEVEFDENIRVVLTAPHKDMQLETDDIAFMLVQYEPEGSHSTDAEEN